MAIDNNGRAVVNWFRFKTNYDNIKFASVCMRHFNGFYSLTSNASNTNFFVDWQLCVAVCAEVIIKFAVNVNWINFNEKQTNPLKKIWSKSWNSKAKHKLRSRFCFFFFDCKKRKYFAVIHCLCGSGFICQFIGPGSIEHQKSEDK